MTSNATVRSRVTVNFTQRSTAALREAVNLTGDSQTDTINRALQIYAFMVREAEAGRQVFTGPAGSDLPAGATRVEIL